MQSVGKLPNHLRPATKQDLLAINDIYNFYVLTSTAAFDRLAELTASASARSLSMTLRHKFNCIFVLALVQSG